MINVSKLLKSIFGVSYLVDGGTKVITREGTGGFIKGNKNMARIITNATGGALLYNDGILVATYARARDARRGAARRGLTVA